jgi:RND family efflux transporter MFP subunit
MKPRWIAIALAALVAAVILFGALSCARRGPQAPPQTPATVAPPATPVSVVTAMRAPISEAVRVTGTVAAVREVDVVPEGAGRVAAVYADVGDRVSKGSLLVQFDTDLLSAQARQATAGVDVAKARLQQAKDTVSLTSSTTGISVEQAQKQVDQAQTQLAKSQTAAETTESTINNQIAQARVGVDAATTQLAEVRRGAREQQKEQARAQVELAQAQYDLTKSQYETKKRLYTQGAASGTEFGTALAQYQGARAQLEQAKQALDLVEEGPTTEQVRLAELQVRQAEEQLRLAETQRDQISLAREDVQLARTQVRLAEEQLDLAKAGKGEVTIRKSDVDAAHAGVKQASAARDLAYTTLDKSRVYAPITGLVAARLVDPGEAGSPPMPVFRLVDISKVYVQAILGEADVKRVSEGQEAIVTVRGVANAEFRGHVVDINPSAIPNQRNFVARILVENVGEVLRPGMSAEVSLIVGESARAIVVPRDCVVEDRDKRVVYAVVNDAIEIRDVELGAEERGRVEIVSGVEEGDLLVVAGQTDLADGQRVEPVQRQGGAATPAS